jgi:hypothetical protein
MVESDIKFYKSSQADCDGGTITATEVGITNGALFQDVLGNQMGTTVYRKIFIRNANETGEIADSIRIFLSLLNTGDDEVFIALGTANDTTPPETWYKPTDNADALFVSKLEPDESQALWLKRVVPTIASAMDDDTFDLKVRWNEVGE